MAKFIFLPGVFLCLIGINALAVRAQDNRALAQQAFAEAEAGSRAPTLAARRQALAKLTEAAKLWQEAGDVAAAAHALNLAGRLQLKLHLPQDSRASYQAALQLLRGQPEARLLVDSHYGLGETYLADRAKKQSQAHVALALARSRQINYPAGEAQALLTMSEWQSETKQAQARDTAQTALEIWQSLGDKDGQARCQEHIGQYYMAMSELADSSAHYNEALQLWRELNDISGQSRIIIAFGFIEFRKGAWQNVVDYLRQAEAMIDPPAEPLQMAQIYSALGSTFSESGLAQPAIVNHQKAIEFARQGQSQVAEVESTWALGDAEFLDRNYSQATTRLQTALAQAEAIDDPINVATCHELLGKVYLAQPDLPAALEHLQRAHDIYRRSDNPRETARTLALLGQVYQRQGNTVQAEKRYRQAEETFRSLSDQVNQSAVSYAWGRLKMEQGDLQAAGKYLEQSIKLTENVRQGSSSRDLTAAFSATVSERYEAYVECLMRQQPAGGDPQISARALQTNELGRARSLAEMLRATQSNIIQKLDKQLGEREQSLRQELRVRRDAKIALLGKSEKDSKDKLKALDEVIAQRETEYEQIAATIKAKYPAYAQATQPVAWTLPQIQEKVVADDNTLLLEYSLGAQHSYLWAVTRLESKYYELPARDKIETVANNLHKLLSTVPTAATTEQIAQTSQELSRMILPSAVAQAGPRRWLIVADGALHYIPFQVLPVSPDGEPLLARHEIINAPSASILGLLAQETAQRLPASKFIAAFGDPVLPSNYAQKVNNAATPEQIAQRQESLATARLQHAWRDMESSQLDPGKLEGLFDANHELLNLALLSDASLIAGDFAATRENLQSTDLSQYRILHFATHALLNNRNPEFSGLVLSLVNRQGQPTDGFVSLTDIYNLRAPMDLVVLSACQTGLGQEVRGEGLIGLTRGFMYAGASSVAATLWQVEDKATSVLMERFYANMLQKNMAPAAALRAAQNELRQQTQWSAPYYWAAFTMQGEYRQPIKPPPPHLFTTTRKAMGGGALLMAALLAGLFIRRRRKRQPANYEL